jgi:hypothetical protein
MLIMIYTECFYFYNKKNYVYAIEVNIKSNI